MIIFDNEGRKIKTIWGLWDIIEFCPLNPVWVQNLAANVVKPFPEQIYSPKYKVKNLSLI